MILPSRRDAKVASASAWRSTRAARASAMRACLSSDDICARRTVARSRATVCLRRSSAFTSSALRTTCSEAGYVGCIAYALVRLRAAASRRRWTEFWQRQRFTHDHTPHFNTRIKNVRDVGFR